MQNPNELAYQNLVRLTTELSVKSSNWTNPISWKHAPKLVDTKWRWHINDSNSLWLKLPRESRACLAPFAELLWPSELSISPLKLWLPFSLSSSIFSNLSLQLLSSASLCSCCICCSCCEVTKPSTTSPSSNNRSTEAFMSGLVVVWPAAWLLKSWLWTELFFSRNPQELAKELDNLLPVIILRPQTAAFEGLSGSKDWERGSKDLRGRGMAMWGNMRGLMGLLKMCSDHEASKLGFCNFSMLTFRVFWSNGHSKALSGTAWKNLKLLFFIKDWKKNKIIYDIYKF